MSRKSRSFTQLYDYFAREDQSGFYVSWNLQHPLSRERVLEQFYRNSRCLNSRKRGNVLYHEIISLKLRPDILLDRQLRALHDLSLKYLQTRAPNSLAFGRLHTSQGHVHIHLMVSSNGLNQKRRHRLSKAEFAAVQLRCERYLQQAYPDLGQPVIYARDNSPHTVRTKQRELEFKKRTRNLTEKEHVRDRLIELLANVPNQEPTRWLRENGFEIYQRGKVFGVKHGGKKYRLTTLGMDGALSDSLTGKRASTPEKVRQDELEETYRKMEQEIETQIDREKSEGKSNQPEF